MLPDIVVENALAVGGSHILKSKVRFYVLYEDFPNLYRAIDINTGKLIHPRYRGTQNYFDYGYNTEECEIIPLKINLENI